MERFCRTLLRWRWPVLAAAVLLFVLAGLSVLRVRFEFSFTQFFPSREHPRIGAYYDYIARFGRDDRVALVALAPRAGDLLTPAPLTAIAELCDELIRLEGVARVDAISTVRLPGGDEGTLTVAPLYRAADGVDAAEIAAVRAAAATSPFVGEQLIDREARAALIAVTLQSGAAQNLDVESDRDPTLDAVAAAATRHLPAEEYEVHLGGVPFVRAGYITLLEGELWVLLGAAALVLAAVLLALFRSLRAVLLPLAVVLLSTLISVAALVLSGHGFSLMSTLIPAIVLIIGIADSVHFLARFQEERECGLDVTEAVVTTFCHIGVACFLTSLTTAVGFLALAVSAIGVISDFGVFAAVGVMLAFAVTVLVLPPLLVVLPPRSRFSLAAASKRPTGRLLAFNYHLAARRTRVVVVSFVAAGALLAAWALRALERDAYFVDDLAPDHPIVAATRFVESRFGGILPLDVVIEGPEGFAHEPAAVRLAQRVATRLRAEPAIGAVVGYGDVVQALGTALGGATVAVEDRATVAQLLLLAEGAEADLLAHFVDPHGAALRVSARVADIGTKRMRPLLATLQAELDTMAAQVPGARATVTGLTPAAVWVDGYMVDQLFFGFVGVFVVITLMMGLLFRSPLVALLTLPPNLIPLIGVLAWMGLFGIELKPTTAIIFSVAFGLGVDNTIHFLTRYRSELARGADARRALSRTLSHTGRGILFASLVLALGFGAVLFAQLGTSVHFATLAIVTIVCALVGVLLLLPSLLLWPQARRAPALAARRSD